jgi:hypothetical protein
MYFTGNWLCFVESKFLREIYVLLLSLAYVVPRTYKIQRTGHFRNVFTFLSLDQIRYEALSKKFNWHIVLPIYLKFGVRQLFTILLQVYKVLKYQTLGEIWTFDKLAKPYRPPSIIWSSWVNLCTLALSMKVFTFWVFLFHQKVESYSHRT